ncbi:LIC_10190 family membrane protein [Chryseobacterium gossypii]|uniref:LIC_10190 family membrane protein n=1 Tax=Chryseobacterium gossypii TaxID=3231602 RepID=UPI0035246513
MVYIFFTLLLVIPALAGFGKIVESLAGPLLDGISGKALSGVLGISLLWTIAAFFIPLNIYTEIPVLISGLFFFFKERLYNEIYRFSKKDKLLIGSIILIVLYCSSFPPFILDHFGYYVPTIKWLTEHGIIKGIANLDLTLGQTSAWHIFQAGFSGFSDPFLRSNATLLIIYALYIIERRSWIQLCLLPFLLLFSQAPSPDLPVIIFSMIILNEIVSGNKKASLLIGLSVFAFTIKPTLIWLPVLSFLYSVFIIKANPKSFLFGTSLLLLFFFKNIWTFGYPVFPVPAIDLGVPWKPNPETMEISSRYAIQKTYDMQYSYQQIQEFSWYHYIKNWLFLDGIKSFINIFFVLSLAAFIIFALIKKNKIVTLICISLLLKSILVLLFSAQYRFFIDVFFAIFFILGFYCFTERKPFLIFTVLSVLFISLLTFPSIVREYLPSFRLGSIMGKFEKKQLYIPSTYEYHQFDTFTVGNLKFNVSKNYPYNFDTALPAISLGYVFDDIEAGIFPQYADQENIREGFIWKKMSPQEKKQAQKVIHIIEKIHDRD